MEKQEKVNIKKRGRAGEEKIEKGREECRVGEKTLTF
jgi:hypothetical protein